MLLNRLIKQHTRNTLFMPSLRRLVVATLTSDLIILIMGVHPRLSAPVLVQPSQILGLLQMLEILAQEFTLILHRQQAEHIVPSYQMLL